MAGLQYYSATHFKTGQTSVTANATMVLPFETDRISVALINHGPIDVYVGTANSMTASASTGGALLAGTRGSSVALDTRNAIWAIAASGTQIISWIADSDPK